MKPTNFSRVRFAKLLEAQSDKILEQLKVAKPGGDSLAGWFLGPKAENADVLKKLIIQALDNHCADREELYPNDPIYVTDQIKQSEAYKNTIQVLEEKANALFQTLKGSVPFFSYRWQSHMNWDTTMPGILGYFGTMLYNPNNVAAEASPVTTMLEILVGDELSKMLGYNINPNSAAPKAWGHITCDGSIANNEAMWAARNLKFYPVSLVQAINNQPQLAAAKNITVTQPNGTVKPLTSLSSWEQLNLGVDEILNIPARVQQVCEITDDEFNSIMNLYSIQNVGWDGIKQFMSSDIGTPVIMAPSDMHYSWPKSAAVVGLGSNNVQKIHVDLNARMRVDLLAAEIDKAVAAKRPIIMTVAVIGSTEESAVDPLKEIVALRKEYNKRNIDFLLHADAAWGGYFASILREPEANRKALVQYTPTLVMNKYVTEQYEYLPYTDSITIDPHKAGYIQYPAGGLCYRNGALRNMVTFTAPVVYHGGVDPSIGVYGLEGSKPGAAPAGVYLSHQVIPLDQSGYGKILGKCLFNSKRLYSSFITMAEPEDCFIIVPFQRLPAQKNGGTPLQVAEEYAFIKEEIVPKTNEQIMANPKAVALLPELGSDQVIISYAFNFKNEDGTLNSDTDKMNQLNMSIFEQLSLSPSHDDVAQIPLMVTQSQFDVDNYGKLLVDDYKKRLGVHDDTDQPVTFLISTTMDPWVTDTAEGNFIPVLTKALKETVTTAVHNILQAQLVE